MKFNRRARLDTSQIRDRRVPGGGGRSMGGGRMAVGGGLGSIVLVIIAMIAGVDLSGLTGGEDPGTGSSQSGGALESCDSGDDVETNTECRFVIYENSIQQFWTDQFEERGDTYTPATFNVFEGRVDTGCGSATSQVGPFYCPPDEAVFLDIGFFDVLVEQLGAQGGDFAEAYVVAHEYGHHIQNILGTMNRVRPGEGPKSDGVRLELQADCYAGAWANHATTVRNESGQPLITEVSDEDITEAIDAAESVGDDYIQERMQGTVTPETWTHGSSSQRHEWFRRGLRAGTPNACDTFNDPNP